MATLHMRMKPPFPNPGSATAEGVTNAGGTKASHNYNMSWHIRLQKNRILLADNIQDLDS